MNTTISIQGAILIAVVLAALATSCAPQSAPRNVEQYPYSDPEEQLFKMDLIHAEPMMKSRGELELYRTVTHVYWRKHIAFRKQGAITAHDDVVDVTFTMTDAPIRTHYEHELSYPVVFNVSVRNMSGEPVTLHWARAAYYDQRGRKGPVIGLGPDFKDFYTKLPDERRAPVVIEPGETVSDILIPRYFIRHVKESFWGWRCDRVLEWLLNGQNVKVTLPVEYRGEVTDYTFTFDTISWINRY